MMKWVKIVLLVQAVAFLILGFVFMASVFTLDKASIDKLTVEIASGNPLGSEEDSVFIDIKERYTLAAWVVSLIAIIEVVILWRI